MWECPVHVGYRPSIVVGLYVAGGAVSPSEIAQLQKSASRIPVRRGALSVKT
jgi:hypothetical protein